MIQRLSISQSQKKEVSTKDFTRINEMFRILKKSKGQVHSRIFLGFGYDDDPREIYNIPEVCTYMDQVYKNHPYMFYYLFTAEMQAGAFFNAIMYNYQNSVAEADEMFKKIIFGTLDYGKQIGDEKGARETLDNLFGEYPPYIDVISNI